MAVDLSDVLGVLGALRNYKQGKSDSRAKKVWERYDRQVDLYALNLKRQQLGHQLAGLDDSVRTGTERAALLRLMATRISGVRADRWRTGREQIREAHHLNDAQFAEARAVLGRDTLKLDTTAASIRAAVDTLYADRLALEATSLADLATLNEQAIELGVRRGVLERDHAEKLKVFALMQTAVELESAGAIDRNEAKVRLLGERLDTITVEEEAFGLTQALRRQETEERAAVAAGASEASAAARLGGGRGSFVLTEQRRIERELNRERLRLGIEGRVKAAGFRTARAQIDAARIEQLTRFGEEAAGFDLRRAQVQQGRTAAMGAYDLGIARLGAAGAELEGRRTKVAYGRLTGRARLGERGVELEGRRTLLEQEGRVLSAREDVAAERHQAGFAEIRGREQRLREDQGALLERESELRQDAVERDREVARTGREREDVWDAKRIADWQRDKLPSLPFSGSTRGGVALLLNVLAQGMD